jgi:hypothetical protein
MVADWLERAKNWRCDELRLVKDAIGWSRVQVDRHVVSPTGCAGDG